MKSIALLLVSLAATLAAPAHATTFASGSISGFTVQLTDLTPLDGVAPSITWLSSPGTSNLGGSAVFGADPSMNRSYDKSSVLQFTLLQGFDISDAANLSSSISNVNGNPTSGLVVQASNQTFGVPASPGEFVQTNAFANTSATFILGPNTSAVFRAFATGFAFSTSPVPGAESTFGTAYLRVSGPGPTSNKGFQSNEDSLDFGASPNSSVSGILAGAFTNASASSKTGFIGAEVTIGAISSVVAVPEPETYALFLAGLALIGTMARRRTR